MATNVVPPGQLPGAAALDSATLQHVRQGLTQALTALASLRLTVALFAMSIFLIFVGTLAQVEKDIWEVIREYFRTPVCWVDFRLFFPPSFFPGWPRIPGGFPFPGGTTIGGLMMLNLLSAHLIRFKIQAKGARLVTGTAVLVLGVLLTWLVVASGSNRDGILQDNWLPYSTLWLLLKLTVTGLLAGNIWGLVTVSRSRSLTWSILGLSSLALAGVVAWLWFFSGGFQPSDSAMRILWQLTKGGVASLVLLAGCWLLFRQRGGIVLLHGGIGLMMLGEVFVGLWAVEAQMSLDEGQTMNYVQDIRTWELAVIDPSDPERDRVVVVPRSVLLNEPAGYFEWVPSWLSRAVLGTGQLRPIDDPRLPFIVEVKNYWQNARSRQLGSDEPPLATAGVGLVRTVEPVAAGTGTDNDSKIDLSAALIQLKGRDGSDLGTRLVGLEFSFGGPPETVTVDGRTYEVSLRFQRHYKPYSVTLVDVRRDNYPGTTTPRNYSSDVLLFDRARQVDRSVKIWMNNPLRFAGETFYQSGHFLDRRTQTETTTLSVVTNDGWMIPYVSCMIVATGMLAQFLLTLLRFLKRIEVGETRTAAASASSNLWLDWGLPAALGLMTLAYFINVVRPRPSAPDAADLVGFGQLPIVYGGRTQPIDTLARNSLLAVTGGLQEIKDADNKPLPAIRWFLDVIAKPRDAMKYPIFRIENMEVQNFLGLERRERFRYALAEFGEKLSEIRDAARKAEEKRQKDPASLSTFDRKVLDLHRKLSTYDLLMYSFTPPPISPDNPREDIMRAIRSLAALDEEHPPRVIPPSGEDGEWQTFASAWLRELLRTNLIKGEPNPLVEKFTELLIAHSRGEADTFNLRLREYRSLVAGLPGANVDQPKIEFESFFNRSYLFYNCSVLYVCGFALTALGWITGWRSLSRAATATIAVTLLVHTLALVARIYISGRPPVTNLYSSAIFIGWGSVILGLLLEAIYRLGIGNAIAAVSGFATLVIAHYLGIDGDTFTVLQAVLDTQFWLATHVTCITLGYSTTYVAGLLGICYIALGTLTPWLSDRISRELYRMIYGTLCFSIYFSFVGTVLGGLWADDSWGRFWGWDPKENGALIIVLWNALALHARWGGLVKERGLAVLAVAGNIAVSWSWFGVNELGVGLHAYGFREGMIQALGLFVLSQLVIIGVGLIPRKLWWSQPGRLTTSGNDAAALA